MRKEIILRVNGSSNGRCTPTIRLAQLAREPGSDTTRSNNWNAVLLLPRS